ncbi:MAG: pilus assembly PilX N-terminal domain-containing protein [Gemmatimonadota bacterium]
MEYVCEVHAPTPQPAGPRLRARPSGAALPMALLSLAVLTALGLGAKALTSIELRISRAHEASVHAFYSADAGLADYLGRLSGRPRGSHTVRLPAGTAAVTVQHLLDLPDSASLYRLRSRGLADPSLGTPATRTLSMLFLRRPAPYPTAAWTAGTPVAGGGAGTLISGLDAAPAGCRASGALAGLLAPPGGPAAAVALRGVPPRLFPSASVNLRSSTGIDWKPLLAAGGLPAHVVVPPGPWPGFGSVVASPWPIIYIRAPDFTLSGKHAGRGTIVARGDLRLEDGFRWHGLLLVGGSISVVGSPGIDGVTVSGLNLLLGETVALNRLGNGSPHFRYESCEAAAAASRLPYVITPLPGSWWEEF